MDGPDDRWLLYDTTPWGRLMLENWWIVHREKGSMSYGSPAPAAYPLSKGLGPRSGLPDRGPKPREVLLLPGFP